MNRFALQGDEVNLRVMKDDTTGWYFDVFGTKIDVNKYAVG